MTDCRQVTRMVSKSLDRRLPFYQRVWVWLHLLMCKYCLRFRDQLKLLRRASLVTDAPEEQAGFEIRLPKKARERIKHTLADHIAKTPNEQRTEQSC
jgi:hypothetical protein